MLTLRSSGGFAGPAAVQTHTVDSRDLSGPERAQLQALVESSRPFEQPGTLLLAAPKPWDFQHTLGVEDGARRCHITLHLAAAEPALRRLVQWLLMHN